MRKKKKKYKRRTSNPASERRYSQYLKERALFGDDVKFCDWLGVTCRERKRASLERRKARTKKAVALQKRAKRKKTKRFFDDDIPF